MSKEFRVVLRKEDDGDGMKMEFPGMDRVEGCWKLAQIAICPERGLRGDGMNAGYFNNIFLGTNWKRLVEVSMLSDMVPRFVFKDKDADVCANPDDGTLIVTLLPDKIEMVMTKNEKTEIVIKE